LNDGGDIMPDLNMRGPYALNMRSVDDYVEKSCIGNYALGFLGDKGEFYIQYVGRSDTDLNARIKAHIGEKASTGNDYLFFKFSYSASAKEAYEKECINYHDFSRYTLDNEVHPDRPDNSNLNCPVCGR
jgi:hypothetical protein